MININLYASGDVSISKSESLNLSALYRINEKRKKQRELNKKNGVIEEKKQYNYKTNARLCRAAASLMQDKYKRIWLITLTVTNDLEHTHETINKSFNLFTKNLKQNYGNTSYIATAEYQKNGSVHYHVLATFKTKVLDFAKITRAWNTAINTIHSTNIDSDNSVRFGGYNQKTQKRYYYISNILHAIKYITKYITKEKGVCYTAKSYFISMNIRNVHLNFKCSDYEMYNYLINSRVAPVYITEYCIMFSIEPTIALDFFDRENDRIETLKQQQNGNKKAQANIQKG